MSDVNDGDLGGGEDAARELVPVDLSAPLVGAIADLGSVVAATEQAVEETGGEWGVVAMQVGRGHVVPLALRRYPGLPRR